MGKRQEQKGIKRYKLLCVKWISNKDVLYKTGKYNHYFVILLKEVESIKTLNHYVVHLKLI